MCLGGEWFLKDEVIEKPKKKSKSYLGVDWTNCVSWMISEFVSVSSVLGEMSCDEDGSSLTRLE